MLLPHSTAGGKQGFTIIELLIAIFIISLVIASVVGMISASNGHVNKIRQETIAINLSREGMESMYTRRNTNWLKWSSEKDKHWLCTNSDCGDGWFTTDTNGMYYILQHDPDGEVSFSLPRHTEGPIQLPGHGIEIGQTESLNANAVHILDETYLIGDDNFIGVRPTGGYYFRAIIPQGLYQKNTNTEGGDSILCHDGDDDGGNCGDDSPKEFLFCTRVEYQGQGAGNGNVELCGSLTNYQE